jgi:hypothetical protein
LRQSSTWKLPSENGTRKALGLGGYFCFSEPSVCLAFCISLDFAQEYPTITAIGTFVISNVLKIPVGTRPIPFY